MAGKKKNVETISVEYDDIPVTPVKVVEGDWIEASQEEVEKYQKYSLLKGFRPLKTKKAGVAGEVLLKKT